MHNKFNCSTEQERKASHLGNGHLAQMKKKEREQSEKKKQQCEAKHQNKMGKNGWKKK